MWTPRERPNQERNRRRREDRESGIGILLLSCLFLALFARASSPVFAQQQNNAVQVFKERRVALQTGDVRGRLDLARWGMDRGLRIQALEVYREVLDLDASNTLAHRALGHVFLAGHWLTTAAAREAEVAVLRSRLERAGLVRFGGGWETREGARKRKAGYEFVDGRWRTRDMSRAARGMVKMDGKWVGPAEALAEATRKRLKHLTGRAFIVHQGKNVIYASTQEEASHQEMALSLDRAVEDLLALLGVAGRASPWTPPVRTIYLKERVHLEALLAWLPTGAASKPIWGRPGKDGTGLRLFRDNEGRPILVVFLDANATPEAARCLLVYGLVRLAVVALSGVEKTPYWISEGLAVTCEVTRAPGYCSSCAGNVPPAVEKAPMFATMKAVKAYLKEAGVSPLMTLLTLTPDRAEKRHLVQAVAFLTFLTGTYPGAAAACLRPPYKDGDQAGRLETVAQKPLEKIEVEFRDWLK